MGIEDEHNRKSAEEKEKKKEMPLTLKQSDSINGDNASRIPRYAILHFHILNSPYSVAEV